MGVSSSTVEWLKSSGFEAKHLREEGLQKRIGSYMYLEIVSIFQEFDQDRKKRRKHQY